MPDNAITTLDGLRSGRYLVVTKSGMTHTIDVDRKTLTRKSSDLLNVWDYAQVSIGRRASSADIFRWQTLKGATVGQCMSAENDDEWIGTSPVVSIERADA